MRNQTEEGGVWRCEDSGVWVPLARVLCVSGLKTGNDRKKESKPLFRVEPFPPPVMIIEPPAADHPIIELPCILYQTPRTLFVRVSLLVKWRTSACPLQQSGNLRSMPRRTVPAPVIIQEPVQTPFVALCCYAQAHPVRSLGNKRARSWLSVALHVQGSEILMSPARVRTSLSPSPYNLRIATIKPRPRFFRISSQVHE